MSTKRQHSQRIAGTGTSSVSFIYSTLLLVSPITILGQPIKRAFSSVFRFPLHPGFTFKALVYTFIRGNVDRFACSCSMFVLMSL
ncbi:uncharacterized protein EDB93DRAFT_1149823 [Suillus bovinus]|uniref:uncharacterized protein n=1 Tax=Suillus bovinus TaxID=48563 RepID=UPI001B864AEB|nr:uncharacterized protein EDB93DRAFT_1149823 [Suillus bovinus]KAG2146129.1 hypothetical protein EDB93DRAFT_1149823 [Suillus bovinus]